MDQSAWIKRADQDRMGRSSARNYLAAQRAHPLRRLPRITRIVIE
jgi:hypothetical protein